MVKRMYFILSVVLLVLAVAMVAGASRQPDTETLCVELIFGDNRGQIVQWKEHVNGTVKCKIVNSYQFSPDLLCMPKNTGEPHVTSTGYRIVDAERVVCTYLRKGY